MEEVEATEVEAPSSKACRATAMRLLFKEEKEMALAVLFAFVKPVTGAGSQ